MAGDITTRAAMVHYRLYSLVYAFIRKLRINLVKQGNNFQARATYQSIVDGYTPADDGIVAEAKARIKNLK